MLIFHLALNHLDEIAVVLKSNNSAQVPRCRIHNNSTLLDFKFNSKEDIDYVLFGLFVCVTAIHNDLCIWKAALICIYLPIVKKIDGEQTFHLITITVSRYTLLCEVFKLDTVFNVYLLYDKPG